MELKQHNAANGVRTRVLPSGRFLVLKIRDTGDLRKEASVEAVTVEIAVIPAGTAGAKRESRIKEYHYKLWRMRRNARHDEYDRIRREA